MNRKAMWLIAAIVVGAILVPQAVFAAVGNFGSGNGTAAVTGNNTYTGTSVSPGGRFSCRARSCRAVWVDNYSTSGAGYGVVSSLRDGTGKAIAGLNSATSGQGVGVYGQSASSTGRAVNGLASAGGGLTYGGFFESKSSTSGANGVFGWASYSGINGSNYGVQGRNDGGGPNSAGVFGVATKMAGNPVVNGVYGRAPSLNGSGLYGEGGAYGFYGSGGYVGGYGFGTDVGIAGDTCDSQNAQDCVGKGKYGLLSYTDAGVHGHLVQGALGNIAGTCAIPGSSSGPHTCNFAKAFPSAPIVIITSVSTGSSNPAAWIDSVTADGFKVRESLSGAFTVNWIAVGLDTTMTTVAPSRAARR